MILILANQACTWSSTSPDGSSTPVKTQDCGSKECSSSIAVSSMFTDEITNKAFISTNPPRQRNDHDSVPEALRDIKVSLVIPTIHSILVNLEICLVPNSRLHQYQAQTQNILTPVCYKLYALPYPLCPSFWHSVLSIFLSHFFPFLP
jgi:hypothetical protein